jgi:hypothetical protein
MALACSGSRGRPGPDPASGEDAIDHEAIMKVEVT